MPRSGTTLVEQILSSHRKVFGADEIDKARKYIERTDNYIHYIFKELEEDDN